MKRLKLLSDQPIHEDKGNIVDGLGFSTYAEIIARAVIETDGPFTIGIFGEWGTGKTSLMRMVKENLSKDNNDTLTIWFNAWRYQHEEHIIIPLMYTIAEEIESNNTFLEKFKEYKKNLVNSIRALAYGFSIKSKVVVPGLAEGEVAFSAKDSINREEALNDTKFLGNSMYHSAFNKMEIFSEGLEYKIVVIIDDLDRCLPDIAIKLLEGIKVVLAQKGFMFIIGLARNVIEGYLQHKYEIEYGIKNFNGSSYLDKMIQLPFYIPSSRGRMENLTNIFIGGVDQNSQDLLKEIVPIVGITCGYNPRAMKRFINNIIIDMAIIHKLCKQEEDMDNIPVKFIAITKALQQRWSELFSILAVSESLCDKALKYLKNEEVSLSDLDNKLRTIFVDEDLNELLSKHGIEWLENTNMRIASIQFFKVHINSKVLNSDGRNFRDAFDKIYDTKLIMYFNYIMNELGKVYDNFVQPVFSIINYNNKLNKLKLSKLMEIGNNIYITGKPGIGKTFLLKYIEYVCSRGIVERNVKYLKDAIGVELPLIPVYLKLIEVQELLDDGTNNLNTLISNHFRNAISKNFEITSKHLEDGDYLLMFDGLDELKIENKNMIFEKIKYFSEVFPKNKFIITSRDNIVRNEFRRDNFTQLEIDAWGSEQIKEYIKNYYGDKFKVDILSENLIEDSLLNTPITLKLLTMLYNNEHNKFISKYEIVNKLISDLLINVAHKLQQNNLDIKLSDLIDFLSNLAFEFFQYRTVNLRQELEGYTEKNKISSNNNKITLLIINLLVESGIIYEENLTCSFSHIIYHKFFIANYLIHQSNRIDAIKTYFENRNDSEILTFIIDNLNTSELMELLSYLLNTNIEKNILLAGQILLTVKELQLDIYDVYKTTTTSALNNIINKKENYDEYNAHFTSEAQELIKLLNLYNINQVSTKLGILDEEGGNCLEVVEAILEKVNIDNSDVLELYENIIFGRRKVKRYSNSAVLKCKEWITNNGYPSEISFIEKGGMYKKIRVKYAMRSEDIVIIPYTKENDRKPKVGEQINLYNNVIENIDINLIKRVALLQGERNNRAIRNIVSGKISETSSGVLKRYSLIVQEVLTIDEKPISGHIDNKGKLFSLDFIINKL